DARMRRVRAGRVGKSGHRRGDYSRVKYNRGMSALPGEDVLKGLAPEARARIDALVSKGWSPPGEHPLARLHGTPLGDHRLLALLGPKNNVGSRYFQLFLADGEGQLGDGSLALGLYNSGQFPAYNWV